MLDPGGFGGCHETVDPLGLGVEEYALRAFERGGQRFGLLEIGRDDRRARREARDGGFPARRTDLFPSRNQARHHVATDIASGSENNCDHGGSVDRQAYLW